MRPQRHVVVLAVMAGCAWGQAASAATRLAGQVVASQYGRWNAAAQGNGQAGVQTVTITSGDFTLPDGAAWMPLAVGTPLRTGGDEHPEVIVPTAVNCSIQGPACTLTASFAFGHERFTLASATAGLQEAVNAAGPGGAVLDDIPVATLYAPLVLSATVRLGGLSDMDDDTGTRLVQATPNTDVIQIGTPTTLAQDVTLQNLMTVGMAGDGSDSGVALHCVNCAKLKLTNITAKNAHDGVFFDSSHGHAYDATVTGSHFIGNDYGVHIVGGSANRLTFVGDTVDGNVYGVFDDGGWVHDWFGDDIEANTAYGYWQQVSQPGAYSGHDLVLDGNYFEANGHAAGQGDAFLGQLVGGGAGNNGAGCINCAVDGNIFNASSGGLVTALNLGAVDGAVSANTYSGYGPGKTYVYASGPAPNYTHVLSLGDGAGDSGASAASGAFGGARAGTISRIDGNGGLTLGGWDQLTDSHGSPIEDTVIESPTGNVSVRGLPGGVQAVNPANLFLDGNSSSVAGDSIWFRNQSAPEYQINSDPFGANAHDLCLAKDLANPNQAQCLIYINPQGKIKFGDPGPTGTLPSRTQDYQFTQVTNGDSALVINRETDSGNSGYLLDLEDKTLSTPLFRIDTNGTVVAGNWNNASSSLTVGALSAASGTFSGNLSGTTASFSGAVALGPGSSVGGGALAPAPVAGQSGTLFASSSFATGQCETGGVSFSSGVGLGMTVAVNPESAPPAGLVWNGLIDAANHVTIRLCNVTTGVVTWSGGAVWDVRVLN